MSEEQTLIEQQARGERAAIALAVVEEVHDELEADLIGVLKRASFEDFEGIRNLKAELRANDEYLERLKRRVLTGENARKQLLAITQSKEGNTHGTGSRRTPGR